DVFEAIAGEFPDADEQLDLVKVDDTHWIASGMLDLYQLELELGMIDLIYEDAGYISVAGLILDKTNSTVEVGTELNYQGVQFKDDDKHYIALGMLDLNQHENELRMIDLIDKDAGYISDAGLILDKTNSTVEVSTELNYQGVQFKVTEIESNRIKSVSIHYA